MTRHAPSVTVVLRAFPVMRNTRAASSRPGQIPSATVYVLEATNVPAHHQPESIQGLETTVHAAPEGPSPCWSVSELVAGRGSVVSVPPRSVRSAIAVTCAKDRRCHRVTDEALAAARAAPGGRPTALCGHHVLATALVCPPGLDCQGCAAAAAPRRTDPGRHRRRTRGRHGHHIQ